MILRILRLLAIVLLVPAAITGTLMYVKWLVVSLNVSYLHGTWLYLLTAVGWVMSLALMAATALICLAAFSEVGRFIMVVNRAKRMAAR